MFKHDGNVARCAIAAVIVASTVASRADAQEAVKIDFEEALRLAREHAPELAAARAEVELTEADRESARLWRHNPTVSLTGGPRVGADETTIDVMFGVTQPIAPGGRAEARQQVADAGHRVARLGAADAERRVVAEAARAFAALLYWQRRAELADRNMELVTEIETVARRRNEVGDVGALEPSVATVARARAESDLARVAAARLDAESRLRWLLGIDVAAELTVTGELREIARTETATQTETRADVAHANAEVEEARARQRLATRDRIPELAIGAVGGREETSTIVKGVLEITLPVFWRGQRDLLAATALEQSRLVEAKVVASRADFEVRTARRKVAVLDEAVASFGAAGLTAVTETTKIASASYRAGAIPLPELLIVRRELVSAEEEFVELLLLAALARIELLESMGALGPTQPPTDQ